VSHETREPPGQDRHPIESGNVSWLAFRTNGQERENPLQSPDAPKKELTGSRQELERLAANVRSVQREVDSVRVPRAPQLPSVPGLPPVDDSFWQQRSLEPEYLVSSPEVRSRLRGPLTIIKVIILIVSIFAVPVAYYFWAGGWDPISKPPPEMMSFASKFSALPPKPSNQEETIIDRDDDTGPATKGEMASDRLKLRSTFSMPPPQPSSQEEMTTSQDNNPGTPTREAMSSDRPKSQQVAKSSAGETVAVLPGTQDPSLSMAVRALDPKEIKLLVEQGERFIAAGDLVTARIVFQRAAEAGDANAAMALAATYDPTVLAKLGVVGFSADVAKARSWYQKAEKLGSPEARRRLDILADR